MKKRSRRLLSAAVGVAFAACTMGVFTSSSWATAFVLGTGTFSSATLPFGLYWILLTMVAGDVTGDYCRDFLFHDSCW